MMRENWARRLRAWIVAAAFALALWAGGAVDHGETLAQGQGRSSGRDGLDGLELAFRYVTVGWLDWAAVQLAETAGMQPESETLVLLGMVQQAMGRSAAALDAYRQGAELARDPRARSAALALAGMLFIQEGRLSEAGDVLARALELSPTSAQAMFGLGTIAEQRSLPDEAVRWYEEAAQASPEWIQPVIRASSLHNAAGRHGRALKLLRRAESLGTWNAEFHYQLALGYEGLMRAAGEGRLDADDAELLKELGAGPLAQDVRLRELALHAADRALQLQPGHRGAEELLARLSQT